MVTLNTQFVYQIKRNGQSKTNRTKNITGLYGPNIQQIIKKN